MARIHGIKIDVTKIPKERIFVGKKGGKWLDLIVEDMDRDDDYGNNVRVSISQTKEERANKEKKIFIGNGRTIWCSESHPKQAPDGGPSAKHTAPPERENPLADYKDDVPF